MFHFMRKMTPRFFETWLSIKGYGKVRENLINIDFPTGTYIYSEKN